MIQEVMANTLTSLETYLKRRNDQEPVTAKMVEFYCAVCASIEATEDEIKAACIDVAQHEEWFPSPATFVRSIERVRERKPKSFLAVYIKDSDGREWVYPKGKVLPDGCTFLHEVGPSLPQSHHMDRALNGNNA